MKMNIFRLHIFLLLMPFIGFSQLRSVYAIDGNPKSQKTFQPSILRIMDSVSSSGETYGLGRSFFIHNGQPFFPVMGEMHFARVDTAFWASSILKMKACGIDIISTYIIWNYHEPMEGDWNWKGRNNLAAFLALCRLYDMKVWLRVGPWVHAEVRDGGFPDFLLNKKIHLRSEDTSYIGYVCQFFKELGRIVGPYCFPKGGPVIGIQIENEFRFNTPQGMGHMLHLRQLLLSEGLKVPFYSATGWPSANLNQPYFLPVWGGYPDSPWDQIKGETPLQSTYLFRPFSHRMTIGNDLIRSKADSCHFSDYPYPLATAELGSGNEVTYRRRSLITAQDETSLALTMLGSGVNMLGYYMFHGGVNDTGMVHTLQESKASHYPNDYPVINYDFYAPLGAWGRPSAAYATYKLLHLFLHNFGSDLCQMVPFFPKNAPSSPFDSVKLRWNARMQSGSGFVFISQYQRHEKMKTVQGVQFTVKNQHKPDLRFPVVPLRIPDSAQAIFPIGLKLGSICKVVYATLQPLCLLDNPEELTFVSFAPFDSVLSELRLSFSHRFSISKSNGVSLTYTSSGLSLTVLNPGPDCYLLVAPRTGRKIRFLFLDKKTALHGWQFSIWGRNRFFIASGELYAKHDTLCMENYGKSILSWGCYPYLDRKKTESESLYCNGLFKGFSHIYPAEKKDVSFLLYEINVGDTLHLFERSGWYYETRYHPLRETVTYLIHLPESKIANSRALLLHFQYLGNMAAVYTKSGRLIYDDFYAGNSFSMRIENNFSDKQLLVQLFPFRPNDEIYFEPKFHLPLTVKPQLLSVSSEPVYEGFWSSEHYLTTDGASMAKSDQP